MFILHSDIVAGLGPVRMSVQEGASVEVKSPLGGGEAAVRDPPLYPSVSAAPAAGGTSAFTQKSVAGAASNALIVLQKLRICP